jgi:TrmH family RNA methyltransferase
MPTPLGAHSRQLADLRDLLTKRGRREQGRFAVEGATMLAEALDGGVRLEAVYATQGGYAELERAGLAGRLDCPIYLVPDRASDRLSALETPPGIVAVAPQQLRSLTELLTSGGPALLLAGIADPGNAGTLLRSAEIFGVESVLFAAGAVEPYNPKVVRASMGAIFRRRMGVVTAAELAEGAVRFGYAVVACDRSGVPAYEFAFPERVVIAVGHERRGVAGWLPGWDAAVSVPHAGGGESLNAGVAGSIVLYEFSRRPERRSR